MAKNLIIFGAGASYGSGDTRFGWNADCAQKLPPLGAKLFTELQNFDPTGWGGLPSELSKKFIDDFEAGMKNLSTSSPYNMAPLQRAMASYFFQFRATTDNLYYKLAQRIKAGNWQGAIVTLNYERLLELSLGNLAIKMGCNNPNTPYQVELCFPHGCCHLFCESIQGIDKFWKFKGAGGIALKPGGFFGWNKAGQPIVSGINVSTYGKTEAIFDPKEHAERIKNDSAPPVMSYFEPLKRTTSGADFIQAQRSRFKDLVNEADNIVIVGIKVREHDEHIWGPLKATNARLIYCSGSDGEQFKAWKQKYRSGKDKDITLLEYFDKAFDEICNAVELV